LRQRKCFAHGRRHVDYLLGTEIEAHDAGFGMHHVALTSQLPDSIVEMPPAADEIASGDVDAEPVSVKRLSALHQGSIGNHQTGAIGGNFFEAQCPQITAPGFVNQAQRPIVAKMIAVIEVADPHFDFGTKWEAFRQTDADSWHKPRV